jgi:hypothetical protein
MHTGSAVRERTFAVHEKTLMAVEEKLRANDRQAKKSGECERLNMRPRSIGRIKGKCNVEAVGTGRNQSVEATLH